MYNDPFSQLPSAPKAAPQQVLSPQRLQLASAALAVLALLFLVGGYLIYGGRTEPRDMSEVPGPAKSASSGCQLQNGFQVCDIPEGPQILSFWTQAQGVLGKPLSDYDPASHRQIFLNGVLGYNPADKEGWQVQPERLGAQDRSNSGNVPEDRLAPAAPPVGAYLSDLDRRGVDISRVFGGIISRSWCDRGTCYQWAERMRFEFPEGSSARDSVRLTPFGKVEASRYVQQSVPLWRNGQLIVCWTIAFLLAFGSFVFFRLSRRHEQPVQQPQNQPLSW